MIESRQGKDFVMPIIEARGLRDELAKMLADQYQMNSEKKPDEEPVIKVEIKGGSFK
jgi:hypothetical protein